MRSPLPSNIGLSFMLVVLALAIAITAVSASQRVDHPDIAGNASQTLPQQRIDLNTANEAHLTLLPGIGPRLAERIVQDREANGRFDRIEDITRVTWIGPSHVHRIKPIAYVSERHPAELADGR